MSRVIIEFENQSSLEELVQICHGFPTFQFYWFHYKFRIYVSITRMGGAYQLKFILMESNMKSMESLMWTMQWGSEEIKKPATASHICIIKENTYREEIQIGFEITHTSTNGLMM